jgi:hypothetical protein
MERVRGERENIYYAQLSSVSILLQPEPNCFTLYNTRKGLGSLFVCAIVWWSFPPSHESTYNGQRSSLTIHQRITKLTCILHPKGTLARLATHDEGAFNINLWENTTIHCLVVDCGFSTF